MASELNSVDVWLGTFHSEAALSEYLQESYSDDHSERPISRFASDQGQWFYDHDIIESTFSGETSNIAIALSGCSFAESFLAEVVERFWHAPFVFDSAILAYGGAIDSPRSADSPHYRLQYLGCFKCDPRRG